MKILDEAMRHIAVRNEAGSEVIQRALEAVRTHLGMEVAVALHLTRFFLTLCGAAAAFVPSAIQGLPDRTLLA